MFHLPRESATVRAVSGPVAEWSTTDHLLASILDVERVAVWQRAGRKNANRPQPVERPGSKQRVGRRRMTIEEMDKVQQRWTDRPDEPARTDIVR